VTREEAVRLESVDEIGDLVNLTPRVLVVDDDHELLTLVSAMLRNLGFDAVAEKDPAAALIICQSAQQKIRVLFMSSDFMKCEWLRKSGRRCLDKPFTLKELETAVGRALAKAAGN
jgi:hypothetical protein